jgi:Ni,Fe-hydrogenase I large subunit
LLYGSARGALGPGIVIANGKIEKYQMVVPTT